MEGEEREEVPAPRQPPPSPNVKTEGGDNTNTVAATTTPGGGGEEEEEEGEEVTGQKRPHPLTPRSNHHRKKTRLQRQKQHPLPRVGQQMALTLQRKSKDFLPRLFTTLRVLL